MKKLLIIIGFALIATINLKADECSLGNTFNVYPNEPLAQAVYEIGTINAFLRNMPEDYRLSLGEDMVKKLRERAQNVSTLLNYVCGQTYAWHLKDMHQSATISDLDPDNFYTRNDFTARPSLLSYAASQGGQWTNPGATFGQSEFLCQCNALLDHLESYLCAEFERTYKKLLDIEEVVIPYPEFENPYYRFFCEVVEVNTFLPHDDL